MRRGSEGSYRLSYLAEIQSRVRCKLTVRSAVIETTRKSGHVIRVTMKECPQAGRFLMIRPEFAKLADQLRPHWHKHKAGEYTMDDGKRVCNYIRHREVLCDWTHRHAEERGEWVDYWDGRVLEVL